MPDFIRDGTGQGYLARVNLENQLCTRAVTVEERMYSSLQGLYYELDTGKITLTNTTETGLLYLLNSNTEGYVIVLDRLFYSTWTSTGGTGNDGTLYYYKNPTVTGGSAITPVNAKYNDSTAAQGTFLKSLTTMSGTVWRTSYITDKTYVTIEGGRIIVPSGNTFGVSLAAPSGNTSMAVSIYLGFYYLDTKAIVG